MKSLSANLICCHCKLYKLGILAGFIYLIPAVLFIIFCVFNGFDLPVFSLVTAITSAYLIKGLMEERHNYLLPWLIYVALIITFNLYLVTGEFGRINWENTYYLELFLSFGLVIQILSWGCIFCLMKKGYQKKKSLMPLIESISKDVGKEDKKEFYNINLNLNLSEHKYNDRQRIIHV